MAQHFHKSANDFARISIIALGLLVAGVFYFGTKFNRSGYFTYVNVAREQPVPFSHNHHVAQLGIDCRYCHVSVETSNSAGIPPTKTCMNCHSQLWTNAAMLEPVRASFRDGTSLEWGRVHDLPDFVYFNHSVHVNKGVACESCHGRVDNMPLMYKANTLHMDWCLACHRAPEKFVRPKDQVVTMGWTPPGGDQLTLGRALVSKYHIQTRQDCSSCHR